LSRKYYYSRRGKPKYKRRVQPRPPEKVEFKPAADPQLKRIFASIGAPAKKPFSPDPFQVKAIKTVKHSDCLVTAPTGAGKTWIAEQAIGAIHRKGGRAWYATPLKALTNAKLTEFSEIFGTAQVGILTGDRKENSDAPIIVGTAEILRNQLYDTMYSGLSLDIDLVVLDEAHYLGDEERGVVWEEIMIYLPERIPLLLLSATIGNAHHIADWLSRIRNRACRVVEEFVRPVPLHPLFMSPNGTLLPLMNNKKRDISKKVRHLTKSKQRLELARPGKLPPMGDILRVLKKYRLLPAIFFLKSRADCDQSLQLCRQNIDPDGQRTQVRAQIAADFVRRFPHIARHRQREALEHFGVGSHHSGQLPAWKLVLEELMNKGLLDVIFATSTVAAGVNFPARSIAFFNSDRFNGLEFVPLDASQFLQMTGRAGRRGIDRVGFALAVPGKFMDVHRVARLFSSPPAAVTSKIQINFCMVLNLLLSHTPQQIESLLTRSFAAYLMARDSKQGKKRAPGFVSQPSLQNEFVRHLAFLKETGFVDANDFLTADGQWASRLRIDQPLLVAEALRLGIFPEKDPMLLAAVMAAFVNDKESQERMDRRTWPKDLVAAILQIKKGLTGFARHMTISGFPVRNLYPLPAAVVYAWARGNEWKKIVQRFSIAEGDLSMLILRTADNLRHIKALDDPFPKAAETAKQSIELILRVPVALEI
jgi:ATP-dependent RNA helicase HelY